MKATVQKLLVFGIVTSGIVFFAEDVSAQKKVVPPPMQGGGRSSPTHQKPSETDATKLEETSPVRTTFNLKWMYKKFPASVRLYEISNSTAPKLNVTLNDNNWQKNLPIVKEVKDGMVTIEGATSKMLAMVIENKTDKPLYFYAAPHSIDPPQGSLGAKFYCLCFGDIFRIKPKTTWYRYVQLRVFSGNRVKNITMSHEILGIDEAKARSIENAR